MTSEEQARIDAVTDALLGEVRPGMRFRWYVDIYTVIGIASHTPDNRWIADSDRQRAAGNGAFSTFREEEILVRLIKP